LLTKLKVALRELLDFLSQLLLIDVWAGQLLLGHDPVEEVPLANAREHIVQHDGEMDYLEDGADPQASPETDML